MASDISEAAFFMLVAGGSAEQVVRELFPIASELEIEARTAWLARAYGSFVERTDRTPMRPTGLIEMVSKGITRH